MRILDAIPRAADAEVTVECNPDSIDAEKLRVYRDRGRQPRLARACSRCSPTCSPRSAARTIRANVARAVDAARARRHRPRSTSTSSTARRGSRSPTGDATLDDVARARPEHVSAYALTVEPGTPLGQAVAAGDRAGARRRRPGRQVRCSPTTLLTRGRARVVRDLELGAAGRRVPPQPPLLDRAATTSRSAAPRTATPRPAPVVERRARPSATSSAIGAGESPEAGEERLDAGATAGRAARPRPAHPGRDRARSTPDAGRAELGRRRPARADRRAGWCSTRAGRLAGQRGHRSGSARCADGQARHASTAAPLALGTTRVPPDGWHSGRQVQDGPPETRRAQGRDPPGDRRGVRRDRAAGRVADGRRAPATSACRARPSATT